MRSRSELWAAVHLRLEELFTQLREPGMAQQCGCVLQGVAIILRITAVCSRYHCMFIF